MKTFFTDFVTKKFCIYFIEHGMPDFENFLAYHKRMESFLLFFIDGASFIDSDDKQWCYYTMYGFCIHFNYILVMKY